MFVMLDRDGVINVDSPDYIRSPAEWKPIPNSLTAISRLNHAGIPVFVVTNQSGVGRHYFTEATLDAIHQKMHDALNAVDARLDGVYVCPHTPDDQCACRKPKPGLLLQIAKEANLDLKTGIFVGDALRDIEAAQAVGALPVLVKTGKDPDIEAAVRAKHKSVPIYPDLASVVGEILSGRSLL